MPESELALPEQLVVQVSISLASTRLLSRGLFCVATILHCPSELGHPKVRKQQILQMESKLDCFADGRRGLSDRFVTASSLVASYLGRQKWGLLADLVFLPVVPRLGDEVVSTPGREIEGVAYPMEPTSVAALPAEVETKSKRRVGGCHSVRQSRLSAVDPDHAWIVVPVGRLGSVKGVYSLGDRVGEM